MNKKIFHCFVPAFLLTNLILWGWVVTHSQRTNIVISSVTPSCLNVDKNNTFFTVKNICGGDISLTTTVPGMPNDVLGDGYESQGDEKLIELWLNSYLREYMPLPFKKSTAIRLAGTISADSATPFVIEGYIAGNLFYGFALLASFIALNGYAFYFRNFFLKSM